MKREYMIEFREKHGWTTLQMAKKCKTSKTLIGMLEASDQEVTHPNIAERVREAYKLTNEQYESLMPEHYRKSSPNYEPDKYRRDDLDFNDFAVLSGWGRAKYM